MSTPAPLSPEQRAEHLEEACRAGAGVVDPQTLDEAEQVLEKVRQRSGIGADYTVIGLFGATGSGKSSLFNALAGREISRVAATRPTTSQAVAAIHGTADPEELLDWLMIDRTVRLESRSALTTVTPERPSLLRRLIRPGQAPSGPEEGGLILVDLPDFDSLERGHREVVGRFAQRVDVMIWVFDPQKYADAVVHREYLEPLAVHGGAMLAVLNQADRLPEADRAAVLEDLAGHLRRDGAERLMVRPPLAVSARTADGLDELAAAIAPIVAGRGATRQRLEADLDEVTHRLGEQDGGGWPEGVTGAAMSDLAWGFYEAQGCPRLVEASEASQRRACAAHTGWPPLRAARSLLKDPLRKVGITRLTGPDARISRQDLPQPGAGSRATAASAVRRSAERSAEGMGQPWHAAVREAARSEQDHLPADLERAVSAADFEQGVRRWWWRPLAVLQWIALAALLVGLGWLGLWWFGEYLRLSLPEPPGWPGESALSRVPIPSVLAIGGILASVLLSLLGTACSRLSARRHARRLHDQLLRGCREVAETRVGDPMRAVLERHAVYCEHLASARREREVRKGRSAGPR